MGEKTQIRSVDGFSLGAYQAAPGTLKGAVVVIQEIFGVNSHIREVVDGYAEAGYFAVAPQIFDRVERDIELGYEESDMGRGVAIAFQSLDRTLALQDIQAAIETASVHGKVAVVGYCFGGLLAWLSACELEGLSAASCYYGGGVAGEVNRTAKCPVMMHFGELDAHIPQSDVAKVKESQPDVDVFVYDADHGFNCDHRASHNAAAAELAKSRTLDFFTQHLVA
ncbi:MAG: dienelactone hydrolase family protein [Gammaproteobacteria bacterium]|jgi:carboxymethylenebutenolidase|nr:dienelactone hydrolase family protein [Gammaproteobacteria bacterium]